VNAAAFEIRRLSAIISLCSFTARHEVARRHPASAGEIEPQRRSACIALDYFFSPSALANPGGALPQG
jgi:hypothetical protein